MSDTATPARPPSTDHRAEVLRGVRLLADLLESDPAIPLPANFAEHSGVTIQLLHSGEKSAAEMAHIRAAIGGQFVKDTYGEDGQYFELCGHLAGLKVNVVTWRDQVCKRVVTGTRTVTKDVPDPQALAAVPVTTVEETVEDFEWVCAPVLGEL